MFNNNLENRGKLNALCCSADSEGVKEFLENNSIDVNYDNGSPLIFAIRSIQVYPPLSQEKSLATIDLLVNTGANVHINEDAPLYWALKVNNHAAVGYLLSKDNHFRIDEELIEYYVANNNDLDNSMREQLEKAKGPSMSI
jgi:hypothetical protein